MSATSKKQTFFSSSLSSQKLKLSFSFEELKLKIEIEVYTPNRFGRT